jgi:hypothetical protein
MKGTEMKQKKIRTILLIALIAVLAFTFTACSDEKASTATVDSFMSECVDGDFTAAARYCSGSDSIKALKEVDSSLSALSGDDFLGTGMKLSDCSKETRQAYSDFIKDVKKQMIKSYKINDDYDDDKKTVSAKVKVLDFDAMDTSNLESKVMKQAEAYAKKHPDVLTGGSTEKAVAEIVDGIAPDLLKTIKTDYLDNGRTKTMTWKFTLEKNDDGEMLIKDISE